MNKQIILLLISLILFGCSDDTTSPDNPNPVEPDTEEPTLSEQGTANELYRSMTDLGFKTFLQIHENTELLENILISPLSIETALYMTGNGAEDETLEEMRTALEFGDFYPSGINIVFKDLLEKISTDASEKSSLNLAQAVFYNPDLFSIDSDFKTKLEDFYSADVFDNKFDLASINGWANEKTEGRIPKVLDKIKEVEFMFLMNALYFLGDWEQPFPAESTRPSPFKFNDLARLPEDIAMMNQDAALDYYIGDDLKAVDLKFEGNKFAMTFIQTPDTVEDYLSSTSYASLSERYVKLVTEQLAQNRLLLTLPKFEINFKRELSDDLKAMGMVRAFEETQAQLNKVGQAAGNIFLTRVIHDTFLKIDEKGAEGAAVTTVGFGVESLPPAITYDKPFLFVLRHVETGIPVFIGKLADPTS